MNKTKRIICICLCVLLIALSLAGVIWALYSKFSKQEAHAEYTDLAGTDTLVNFNQYINFTSTSSHQLVSIVNGQSVNIPNTLNQNIYCSVQIPFVSGHIYYFYTNNYSRSVEITNDSGSPYVSLSSQYVLFTSGGTATGTRFYFLTGMAAGTYSFSYIDLTQMFGAGNEPNLEQAKEYFTADYYSYNSGTPIPYSKDYLEGYQDGANDLYESMTITYNAYTIGSTSTTYANNTIARGELIFDNQYGAYMFSGVIGVNLMGNVERGTNFSIDFDLYIPDLQGESSSYAASFLLHFGIVQNNELVEITAITPQPLTSSNTNTYTGDFQLTQTTDIIYIWVDYSTIGDNTSPTQCFAFKSEMTFKSTDMGLLMNNSYQRGYSAAMATYTPGTDNYEAIYQLGFNNGVAQQNATLGTMEYIGAAFTGIGSILAIELLPGIPFSLFVLLPLMFGLIAFVVKLSKGGD